MSGVSRSRTANSSPPRRAAMSLERRTEPRRSPTATRSASPAACPRLSLTSLKSSRSTNRTIGTIPLGSRASRREATTCVNSDRLASPVSGSCNAWWCSSSLSRPSCSSDCSNRPFSSAIAVWLARVSKSLRSSGSNVLMSLRESDTRSVPTSVDSPVSGATSALRPFRRVASSDPSTGGRSTSRPWRSVTARIRIGSSSARPAGCISKTASPGPTWQRMTSSPSCRGNSRISATSARNIFRAWSSNDTIAVSSCGLRWRIRVDS